MPKPKDPTKAARLRWSAEEIDHLVREAAKLMLEAERKGTPLPKSKAVDLAQHVLPKDRRRRLDSTFKPSWMGSEGRIEAMIDQLRAALPPSPAAPAPQQVLTPAPAKKAPRSAKLREQATLVPPPPSVHARHKKVSSAENASPAPPTALEATGNVPGEAVAPASVPQPVVAVPAAEAVPRRDSVAVTLAEPQQSAEPVAAKERVATPTPAIEQTAAPVPETQHGTTPSIVNVLASLEADVLAGALRTIATKALAGLLVDVLRQPEVQAALRHALGSALTGKPFKEQRRDESDGQRDGGLRDAREERGLSQRQADHRAPAAPRAAEKREARERNEEPAYTREREPDDEIEPVPLDPNAWQATPLHALPERSARGASDAPRPTVAVFGLLPRDQQRLKAEFGQRFKLRFGSNVKTPQVIDTLKDVDQVYSLVRFIPQDLDRGLATSGVPYSPLKNIGELRHELQVNPPLPREETL